MFPQTKFKNKLCSYETISRVSLTRKKIKILCNDADAHKKTVSPYLLRKRSKFYELMLTHIKKNKSLFLLKTKTYL